MEEALRVEVEMYLAKPYHSTVQKMGEWRMERRSNRKSSGSRRTRGDKRKRSIEENMKRRRAQRTGVKNWTGPPKGKGEAAHCSFDI